MNLSQEQKFKFRLRLEQEQEQNNQPREYFSRENMNNVVSDIARPALEMGGGVAGGIIGSALGPLGTVGGGAGGYAIGKTAADILERSIGTKKPSGSYREALVSEPAKAMYEGVQQEAMGAAINPLMLGFSRGAANIGKKSIASFLGPSEKSVIARFERPADLINAKPLQDVGDDLAKTVGKIESVVSKQDQEAWGKLFRLKSEPRSKIVNVIKEIRSEIKVPRAGNDVEPIGPANEKAYSTLNKIIKSIESIKQPGVQRDLEQMLDQQQMRKILQDLDQNINWEDQSAEVLNNSLQRIRGKINSLIKESNPAYAEQIEELAKSKELLDETRKKFSIVKKGGEFISSDTTPGKLKLSLDEKRARTKEILNEIKQRYGDDIAKKVEDRLLSEQFSGSSTTGSRKAVLGTIAGAGVGTLFDSPGVGGVAGVLTGTYLDSEGKRIAGGLVDLLNKLPKGVIASSQPLTRPFIIGAMGFNRKNNKN